MKFKYEAMDAAGREVKDEIEAEEIKAAQDAIREKGYFVTKICPYGKEKRDKPPVDFHSPFMTGLYVGIFAIIAIEAIGGLLWLLLKG